MKLYKFLWNGESTKGEKYTWSQPWFGASYEPAPPYQRQYKKLLELLGEPMV